MEEAPQTVARRMGSANDSLRMADEQTVSGIATVTAAAASAAPRSTP